MLLAVLEALTGTGLAASAGLNAYIPLLAMGTLGRYTDVIELPSNWSWLENGWTLSILAVLLAVEMVADKVPMVDSANDVVQTVIRPTSGGLAFGAGSSAHTATVTDPGQFFGSRAWIPVAVGVGIALAVHAVKALVRPVINATTAFVGGAIASTVEDAVSVVMSIVAILLPVLIVVFVVAVVPLVWWALRRRRVRRRVRTRPPLPSR